MLMAASIVPRGTGINGEAQETVSMVTSGTRAPDVVSLLRTRGSFSASSVPHLTQVHHWGAIEGQRGRQETIRDATSYNTWRSSPFQLLSTCAGETVSLIKWPTRTGIVFLTDGHRGAGGGTLREVS